MTLVFSQHDLDTLKKILTTKYLVKKSRNTMSSRDVYLKNPKQQRKKKVRRKETSMYEVPEDFMLGCPKTLQSYGG